MTYRNRNRPDNLEDREVILNWKQMAIYIGGICLATFTVAGVYFKQSSENSDLRKDNARISEKLDKVSERLDKVSDQYTQVMIELAKKQDKK